MTGVLIALAIGLATWTHTAPLQAHTPDGAEAEVEAVLEGKTVGDPITIFVRLTYAVGGRLILPDLAQPLGALEPAVPELVESAVTEGDDPHATAVVVLRTRAFVTGTLPVVLPELTLIDAAGAARTVTLPPFELEILSVLPADPAQATLRPLKSAERIDGAPVALELVLGPILGGIALLLFAITARRYLRRRRIVVPEAPPNPVAIATAELGAIREAGLLPSRLEEFCRRVDLTVRRFLADRYALPAVNLTANELASRLARAGVEAGTIRRVRSLCAETDAVAYAGAAPAAERVARYVELAQAIVQPPQLATSTGGAAVAAAPAKPSATTTTSAATTTVRPAQEPRPAAPERDTARAQPDGPPTDSQQQPDDDDSAAATDRWSRPPDGGDS
jgi:hypothetical protein